MNPPAPSQKLVVMVPCLDEEQTITDVVLAVPHEIEGISSVEVLVIDDGSTDDTAARATAAGARVLSHPTNLGLGRSFRDGVGMALALGADLVVNIDGDGQFDPADIPQLIQPVLAGKADMVTASRFADPKLRPRMPRIKQWGNRWVAWIIWLVALQRFHDVSCGFRAFSREALLRTNLFGSFTYTQEIFLDLLFKGLTVRELPVRVRGEREFGESRVASSIPRYAYRSLRIMMRAAIGYRPLRFFATLAAVFLALGLALLSFLAWHYLQTGAFSPHIWSGFVGGSFVWIGLVTLVIGFLADMLVVVRLNQEKILYRLKREEQPPTIPGATRETRYATPAEPK